MDKTKIFPPFSLVAKSISKIIYEKASGIMVIPGLPTLHWFPIMTQLLADYHIFPQLVGSHIDATATGEQITFTVPQTSASSIRLSRKQLEIETFQRKLSISFVSLGEIEQHLDMYEYSEGGRTIDVDSVVTDVKTVLDFLHGVINVVLGTMAFAQPEVLFLVL